MSSLYVRIAQDLLSSFDELLSLLADDPVLHPALGRERERLVNHLHLALPRGQELATAPGPQGSPRARIAAPARDGRGRPRRRGPAAARLRAACYAALSSGLLGSQRFDAVMLLGRRAAVQGHPLYASSSSLSSAATLSPAGTASKSGDGDDGFISAGGASRDGPGDPGPGNGDRLVGGRYASYGPWPSCTKRMMASTMRPCA
jgi:hypothetical protein